MITDQERLSIRHAYIKVNYQVSDKEAKHWAKMHVDNYIFVKNQAKRISEFVQAQNPTPKGDL